MVVPKWEDAVSADGMMDYRLARVRLPFGVGLALTRRRVLIDSGMTAWGEDHTRRHEEQHLRQYRVTGHHWPLVYLWLWLRAGCSYRRHPWEVEARQVSWRDSARTDWLS